MSRPRAAAVLPMFVLIVESDDLDDEEGGGRGVDMIYGPMEVHEARERAAILRDELWAAGDLLQPSVTIVHLSSWIERERPRLIENAIESL